MLFRQIYRYDFHTNRLNVAKPYMPLVNVRQLTEAEGWIHEAISASDVVDAVNRGNAPSRKIRGDRWRDGRAGHQMLWVASIS